MHMQRLASRTSTPEHTCCSRSTSVVFQSFLTFRLLSVHFSLASYTFLLQFHSSKLFFVINWTRYHDHWDTCLLKELSICTHFTSCWCRSVTDRGPFTAVMGAGEWWSWCPFPLVCVFQGTDSLGKQMHSGQRHRGHIQDVVCVEGYQVSIFFCLNDKPNCDPFNTRTDNLKDIHLGGLFIYEQEPENSWLQGALQHDWVARVLCKVLKDQQCPLV